MKWQRCFFITSLQQAPFTLSITKPQMFSWLRTRFNLLPMGTCYWDPTVSQVVFNCCTGNSRCSHRSCKYYVNVSATLQYCLLTSLPIFLIANCGFDSVYIRNLWWWREEWNYFISSRDRQGYSMLQEFRKLNLPWPHLLKACTS